MQARLGELWRRWRDSPARDPIYAVLIAAVLVSGSYGEAHPHQQADIVQFRGHGMPHTPTVALLLVAAACLVLAVKRRYPVTVLLASTAFAVAYSFPRNENGAVVVAPAIALFTVAQLVPIRRALVLAAVTLAALMGATAASNPFNPTGGGFYLIVAMVAAALFGGIAIANRRAYVASIHARVDEEARRRVDEERLRIARELHDVVAHSMATISVQAGVAEHVLAANPAATADALRAIRLASRDGLRDLRAILAVLRQADEADPVEPAPGLAQLDTLVGRADQAGLATTVHREGAARPLPSGIDLAAYRIIQESLTNVFRHAGPATATVLLRYNDSALRIEVSDTGRGIAPGADSQGTGHGIIGMRERATAVGGTLEAGPALAGGYQVVAVLPLPADTEGFETSTGETGSIETGSRS
ncbi:MAG TPA: sensor histidine kinase [Streptosporangiaceae bacterium]|nr:sensor histidine kinase [Streptosporangiaceae bacterium]